MLRWMIGSALFWALLVVVVYVRLFFDVGAAAVVTPLPEWLWLPYTATGYLFERADRTFVAGLVGTVVGGLISWAIARQTAREARATAKESRFQSEKASALRAIIKTGQLTNSIHTIHRYIETQIESARKSGIYSVSIWNIIQVTAYSHKEINFNADDLLPFTVSDQNDLIQKMLELSEIHNNLSYTFSIYLQKRADFKIFAEPHARLNRATGVHDTIFTGDTAAIAEVKTFELDSLSRELRANAAECNEIAQATCFKVNQFGQKRYGRSGGFVKLQRIDGVDAKGNDA